MLQVSGLLKRFASFTAVAGIDLQVAPGEVVGLLGPNGAGKTTTMRLLAGLLRPSAGRISIDGHDLLREPLAAKAVTAFLPDRPYLYEKLTGFELLELVGGLYHLPRRDTAHRAGALLERFGLADWAGSLVESYSHGMKQRLVFCVALLPEPKLLMVDEPMVGLDPRGARLVKAIFRELCEDRRLAILLSTHTLSVAEEVCDRIAIINHGRIVALGTMDELRQRAATPGSHLEEIFLRITEEEQEAEVAQVERSQGTHPAAGKP